MLKEESLAQEVKQKKNKFRKRSLYENANFFYAS